MKYLKSYKLYESSSDDFEPGVDLEYIDIFLEDIVDKGYDVKQYFGFEAQDWRNRAEGSQKVHHMDRRYIDNLLLPARRTPSNEEIYQDYLKGDMSYVIKIYSYMEEKGYKQYDFPFGEVTYSDVYGPLKQLIGYMSEERGLSYYTIKATISATRSSEMVPWKYTTKQFTNIEDLKDVKIIGCLVIQLSKNKELLVDNI